jgi:hypothetical protein
MYCTGLIHSCFTRRTWPCFRNRVVRETSKPATLSPKAAPDRLPTAAILLLSWFGA